MDCKRCGRCCRYVTLDIQEPKTEEDWDELHWFLCHSNVVVLYDTVENEWQVQFNTPCKEQDANGECGIHGSHPSVCSKHTPDECECNNTHPYIEFRSVAELKEYREEKESKKIILKQEASRSQPGTQPLQA